MIPILIATFSILFSMGDGLTFAHEFSLHAPDAIHVNLVIFENVEDSSGVEYPMKKIGDNFINLIHCCESSSAIPIIIIK